MNLRRISISIGLLLITGCASDVMRDYVGRDITSVIAQYGPPTYEFDMPDGRRAFQWERLETHHVPETTIYEEKSNRRRTRGSSITLGGHVEEEVCFYTMYAEPGPADSWRVVGFEKPRLECA